MYCCLHRFSAIVCYEGEIQLSGGASAAQGAVELCATNRLERNSRTQWHFVCSQRWSPNDAKVVCRQLGYNDSEFICTSMPIYCT